MSALPQPNETAARELGLALRRAGYSDLAVTELLGDDAFSSGPEEVPAYERRLPRSRLATVIRAFMLGLPVSKSDAAGALGRRGLSALERSGLAEVGSDVVPLARILPIGDLLIAADGHSLGDEDSPDWVAAYTPTSRLCDHLTPRRKGLARALDVGTGSGVQALIAARYARQVVATDVNPRALAYARFNAGLNAISNLECRAGSLFEPVQGETFDLVTCNAPYVVSPAFRWAYRDAGGEGDEVSERIVRTAAASLADGGYATLIVSWLGRNEEEADERALAWTESTGCDSWLLSAWESDPLGHAAAWNSDLASDPVAFGSALDEWTRYVHELGAGWVSDGAVLLHRRPGRRHSARVDGIDEDTLEDAGRQIQRAFAARAWLSELGRQADLLDARLSLAATVRLERELSKKGREREAAVSLADGTCSVVETTGRALEVVAVLDGRATLREAVDAVAGDRGLSGARAAKLRREALRVARELLELGALRIHD